MNKLNLLFRIALVASSFLIPWWLVLILVLAALFFYDAYYEIILIGFVCDVLYGTIDTVLGQYALTLSACILFIVVYQIKKRLILY